MQRNLPQHGADFTVEELRAWMRRHPNRADLPLHERPFSDTWWTKPHGVTEVGYEYHNADGVDYAVWIDVAAGRFLFAQTKGVANVQKRLKRANVWYDGALERQQIALLCHYIKTVDFPALSGRYGIKDADVNPSVVESIIVVQDERLSGGRAAACFVGAYSVHGTHAVRCRVV